MAKSRPDLLQGILDVLVLKTVLPEPLHGYAVAQRIRQISGDRLRIPQGSLYPALHRLENKGFLKGEWRDTPTGREAKFYRLTPKGRRQLDLELAEWRELSIAVAAVLDPA